MSGSVTVLYEDEETVVVDKPAGLLVIPSPREEHRTLTRLVNEQYVGAPWRLHPCHRLDKETSGVIMFAKGKKAQGLMMRLFQRRQVDKTYLALAHGCFQRKRGTFSRPVRHLEQRAFRPAAAAKSAVTHYEVLAQFAHFALVKVCPLTGRTNQIRIHFAQAGHPLLGDRKYAFQRDYTVRFRRTALHASALRWRRPADQKTVQVEAPWPKDMEEFLGNNR